MRALLMSPASTGIEVFAQSHPENGIVPENLAPVVAIA